MKKKLYNFKEQLSSIQGLNHQQETILNELKLPENTSFEDKKELLKKYIKNIKIYYDNKDTYFIEIEFTLFGMDSVVYVVRNNYKIAHTIVGGSNMNILANYIILDENIELTIKNGSDVNIDMQMDSVAYFDKVKKECNLIT